MRLAMASLILFSTLHLSGQVFNGAEIQLSTNPAQYAFSGANVRYAEMNRRFRLGLDLTFRPASCNGCGFDGPMHGLMGDYVFQNFFNPNYTNVTIGLSFDQFGKEHPRFFSAQPYFRYWWFSKKRLAFDNVEGYSFNGLRSEEQIVIGLRLLYGESYKLWESAKTKGAIELSIGPGLFFRQISFFTHQGQIGGTNYENYQEPLEEHLLPTLHIRADFTLSFLEP